MAEQIINYLLRFVAEQIIMINCPGQCCFGAIAEQIIPKIAEQIGFFLLVVGEHVDGLHFSPA